MNQSELSIKDFVFIFFAWLQCHIVDPILGIFERFADQFQWHRKRQGGKWALYCYKKRIYWSRNNTEFVEIMAELGQSVDVLKTEDWD